jgi:Flp pilus assembly protein TadD
MKRTLRCLAALSLVVFGSIACGESRPAQQPTATITAVPAETATTPPPPASSTPPPAMTTDSRVTQDPQLPPPKATTIPLAKTGDAALDATLSEGDKAFEAGDLKKALRSYEEARKAAPKRAAPLVGMARVKVMQASPNLGFAAATNQPDVVAASKDLKRAVELETGFGPAHVEYGRALLLLGDAPGAEAALRKGVKLVPDEAEAHSAFGVALLAAGKAEEALGELMKAKELDPGSAARRGNLGTVLFMRGKVPDAIKEYEIQVRLAPDDPRAHSDLGTAFLAQNDFTRALPELRKAVELDPKRATFHSNLGYGFQLQGRLSDAIAEYREALKLDSKLSSAWINLATALARDPKTRGEARQALKTAAQIDPTDPRVKANLEELDALEKQQGGSTTKASPPTKNKTPNTP